MFRARPPFPVSRLAGLSVVLALSTGVYGGEIVQERDFDVALSPGTETLTYEPFDDFDGRRTLVAVTVELNATLGSNLSAENNSDTLPFPDLAANLSGFVQAFAGPITTTSAHGATVLPGSVLDVTDGIPGSGPDFHDFERVRAVATAAETATDDLYPFAAGLPVDIAILAIGGATVVGPPEGTISIQQTRANGRVRLVYEFDGPVRDPDIDGSGAVDLGDLLAVLTNWGPCPGCAMDLDDDGQVGVSDLVLVLAAWDD